uniref:hypothetical protein n=1 Tax=Raoultella ornithinolytica TaxID=54291 RepID=UPI0039775094
MLQYAAAQVAMAALNAFTQWIGVPYVGPAVAPAQAIAAAAAAGVFMTAIGSALHGQAHDGIDSVPETGTWLLQKGERVTTAKTSAKLDATLDRVFSGKLRRQYLCTNSSVQRKWRSLRCANCDDEESGYRWRRNGVQASR